MAKGPAKGNGYKSTVVKNLIDRIEKTIDSRESALGSYRSRCATIKKSLDSLYAEAEVKNIPVKSLKAYINGRQRVRTARKALENLPPEEQFEVTLLAEAMGDDLPLFKFARSKEVAADLETLMTTH
jgi:hypothetical protein